MQRNPWDEIAHLYDEARPSYPGQLIQDIIDNAQVSPGSRLLELGAGSGKATVLFAQRGFAVHCVEPGRRLVDILVGKCSGCSNVTVDVCPFEEWAPSGNSEYDLVYCAQAFNWIDPAVRYQKCHELLKEDGHLALFWYSSSAGDRQLEDAVDSVIRLHVPDFFENGGDSGSDNGMVASWESDISSSGMFREPQVFSYSADTSVDTDGFLKILYSVSKFAMLSDEIKARISEGMRKLIDQQGGMTTSRLDYKMYLAKKI